MRGLAGVAYHKARAATELKRADEASDAKTAALHRELAKLHLLSAGGDDVHGTELTLTPVDSRPAP